MSYENLIKGADPYANTRPAGPVEVQAPVLDQARNTLKQANEMALRIVDLADRLLGPGKGSDKYSEPTELGAELHRFRAEMRDTRQAMTFADDALTRIEQELIG